MSDNRTVSVSTRFSQGWAVHIVRHRERMQQTRRTTRTTLADALRDLIALGIESQEPGIRLFGGQAEQFPCQSRLPHPLWKLWGKPHQARLLSSRRRQRV